MTAVVFIDVQNDFVKGGALPYAYPVEPNHQKIVEFANTCRSRGYQLYATRDTHKKTVFDGTGGPCDGYLSTLEGQKLPIEHCIEKTEGHRLIEGLVRTPNKLINIPKGHIFDKETFGSTALAWRIYQDFIGYKDDKGVNHPIVDEPLDDIWICGYCTSICVVSNALLLRKEFHNTRIIVLPDLCGDISDQAHFAALEVMKNCQIDIVPSDLMLKS